MTSDQRLLDKAACLGLRDDMTVILESGGHLRMCDRDRFRGRSRGGFAIDTPGCTLGAFEVLDKDQFEALKRALDAERRTSNVGTTRRMTSP